jgi:glyoxylase-like metal-dependent hydrolase (beta-lactamase superfamily II)
MRFGDFEVNAVDSGRFRLDGGAMFGVVPKVLWEKTNPADEKNRIDMALRCMLVRGHGKTVLVDCGIGEKWNDKQKEIYAIDHSRFQMDSALAEHKVSRSEVTDVIISHLHFDHVGGATRYGVDGKIELTFPNARYHVHRANLSHAHAPSEKDKASFIDLTIRPLEESGRITLHDDSFELVPGLSTWVTNGHTPGQQLVKVASKESSILFCGDTIPTASHVPVPYVMGYDMYPVTTIEEKKKILPQAFEEKWTLFWVHDPLIAACQVAFKDGKFSRGPAVTL